MNYDEFEHLLKNHRSVVSPDAINRDDPERLVADENASIDDFILMLSNIISKVMKKQKVEFKPDEGIRIQADQMEKIEHPYIFYRIILCTPVEQKPRIRDTEAHIKTADNDTEDQPIEIWGQLFRTLIQFDVLASGYDEVTKVMKALEDTIFSYTAYFKRKGVKDIRFSSRITDSNLDMYRQKCSIRSLQYTVDIEKIFTKFSNPIIGDIALR